MVASRLTIDLPKTNLHVFSMRGLFLCVSVVLGLASAQAAPMRCLETDAIIEIFCGEKSVLVYNKVPTEAAASNEPFYSRTGYIHPLRSPSGKIVTGDYAPDHPHQHGLFFAWTKTEFEGREAEFWNQKLEKGRVSYEATLAIVSEDEVAGFDVQHLWEDLSWKEGAKPVLREKWSVRAREVEGRYEIDLVSEQQSIAESPLTIKKYHYGGMAIRGNAEWLGETDRTIVTSEGKGRKEGNHTRPTWVRMQGEIDGELCGVVAIQDPSNFRYPQWVRLHPSKPYFVFAPMVEEPFEIKPSEDYVTRTKWVVFDGDWQPKD